MPPASRPIREPRRSPRRMDDPARRIAVGRVNAPWGLKGHVKVTPYTSNPERFASGSELLVRGKPTRVIEVVEPRGYPIVLFEGYASVSAAEALRGALIEIEGEALPELPQGEYYVHDLVGLTVRTRDGAVLGELAEVLTTGANDVYVVRRPGERDVLVPAIPDVVLDIDLEARTMTIEALEGLLG